jgi:hypothetical protein
VIATLDATTVMMGVAATVRMGIAATVMLSVAATVMTGAGVNGTAATTAVMASSSVRIGLEQLTGRCCGLRAALATKAAGRAGLQRRSVQRAGVIGGA